MHRIFYYPKSRKQEQQVFSGILRLGYMKSCRIYCKGIISIGTESWLWTIYCFGYYHKVPVHRRAFSCEYVSGVAIPLETLRYEKRSYHSYSPGSSDRTGDAARRPAARTTVPVFLLRCKCEGAKIVVRASGCGCDPSRPSLFRSFVR